MKVGRVKCLVLSKDGGIVYMRTAFEHNAASVCEDLIRQYAAQGAKKWFTDMDGDYVVMLGDDQEEKPLEQERAASAARAGRPARRRS